MPIFQYSAYNAAGKEVSGNIEAITFKEAVESLKRDGLYPKELKDGDIKDGAFTMRRKTVSSRELASTTRQLSTLLSAGTQLYDALSLLINEEENSVFKKAIISIKEDISGGSPLSKALFAYSDIFPEMYIRSVEAGEVGGTLDKVLERLAEYLEVRARIYEKMKTAMLYPFVMTIVGIIVLSFLFIYVIPKITNIFEDTRHGLPLITTILLFIVNIFRGYWLLILIGMIGSGWGIRMFLKTAEGKEIKDRFSLRLPYIGKIFIKFYMASFARTLGGLLSSGVPILKAIDMTKKVLNHSLFEGALDKVIKDVTEGVPLSMSLKKTGFFPTILTHMIATGERSGELDTLLIRAAYSYERDLEESVERFITLLEPLLILTMGVIVGVIVIAILLPIFELNQVIR